MKSESEQITLLLNPKHLVAAAKFATIQLVGGGRWIRTTEAFASDLQSDPFDRSGTPPEKKDILIVYDKNVKHDTRDLFYKMVLALGIEPRTY